MAKVLQKSAQKSSMSRFLDRDAVSGALGQLAEEVPVPRHVSVEPAQSQPVLRVLEREAPEVRPEVKQEAPVRQRKPAPAAQTLIRGGELYLTPRSSQILNELVGTFKEHTNRAVAPTHMLRGLLLAIQSHLPEVRKEIAAMGPLKRPANESQFALDREEFEKKLGEAILRGVKG